MGVDLENQRPGWMTLPDDHTEPGHGRLTHIPAQQSHSRTLGSSLTLPKPVLSFRVGNVTPASQKCSVSPKKRSWENTLETLAAFFDERHMRSQAQGLDFSGREPGLARSPGRLSTELEMLKESGVHAVSPLPGPQICGRAGIF